MKKNKKIVIVLFLLIFISNIRAQLTQIEDMSTGINGGLIAAGSNDDTWQVMKPGTSVYVPVKCSYQTFNNGGGFPMQMYSPVLTNVMLLSPSLDAAFSTMGTTQGVYLYKMTFWHYSCSKVSASIHFNWIGADNQLQGIKVNSTYLGIGGGYSFNPWSNNVNVTVPVNSIVQGLNTIIIEVRNDHGPLPVTSPAYLTPSGLLIDGALTIKYIPLSINPAIATAPSFYCAGTPLQFTSLPLFGLATNHKWQMQECSSTGVVTSGGYSYSSAVMTGAPGLFTFPNPPCGRYYLVKFLVNNTICNLIEMDTRVIFVACNPSKPVYTGNTTLCLGESTTLCSYPLKGQYVTWYVDGEPYMEDCITITPDLNTTVVLTVSNNNGCSSSISIPITLIDNDPTFNLQTNYINGNSYYTVSLTPVYGNGYSVPGFGFSFWIEEVIETSPNVFVSVPGTNTQASTGGIYCWWIYPGPVTFSGYTGVSNVTCGTPPDGQFTIGKKYRITRGTWNNYCPWNQSSQVVYMSGSMRMPGKESAPTVTIIKDNSAPDMSSFKSSKVSVPSLIIADNVSIYPNPSNGVFTIKFDKATSASIEVYDVTGRKVKSYMQSTTKETLDLTGFAEGMYSVNIISNGNKTTKRIILK